MFKPAEAGRLERCADVSRQARASRTALDAALIIHWAGGDLEQTGSQDASRSWPAFNGCFLLTVAGRDVAAGAIVPRHSARLLTIPTLALRNDVESRPLEFDLSPSFPADPAAPAPQSWRAALTPLGAAAK